MRRKSFEDIECGIAQALERIGDPWTLLIVREILLGTSTFEGLHSHLGIARNTLAARLRSLAEAGILERHEHPSDGRRTRYRPTEAGRELLLVLATLQQWGNKWAYGDRGAPTMMVERRSHKPIAPIELRSQKGRRLHLRDVTLSPGPTASPALLRRFELSRDPDSDAR